MSMLICIDAGHYLGTPGKRCLKSIDPGETREWELNGRAADKVQALLAGYDCRTMRVDDPTGKTEVSLAYRVAKANKAKADIYISIHHNAGIKGGSGGGIVVYVCSGVGEDTTSLQKAVYEATVASTGLRGNRSNPLAVADFYVLVNTTMPAILGEFGFMDSTTDTPIILTEEYADQLARGIVTALVEKYNLQHKALPAAATEFRQYPTHKDFAVPVSAFALELIDRDKNECGQNYCNAGYFGNYSEGGEAFTLPVGHLVADLAAESKWVRHYMGERGSVQDGKVIFDSSKWPPLNVFYGKAVSTLMIRDGVATIQEAAELPQCDYAVAGIPVLRDGIKATTAQAMAQGWDRSSLRATYHVFAGLNGDGKIHIMGIQTRAINLLDSGEVAALLLPLGFTDVIKLDGGGSYILETDAVEASTGGSRRICSIVRFKGEVKPMEIEKPEKDPGYEQWKAYFERYRKELQEAPMTEPWERETIQRAIEAGISDGSRPRDFMTRVEGMAMELAKQN